MARFADFVVSLANPSTRETRVNFATLDGTAKAADGDYVPRTGTLTFAVGETTKTVSVETRETDLNKGAASFSLVLSAPVNGKLSTKVAGLAVLPSDVRMTPYLDRFDALYDALHDQENRYFGPHTGPTARQFTVPKHIAGVDSLIINEAPDCGSETVSETASFWVGLEAWKGYVSAERGSVDWAGYKKCWDSINKYYVPNQALQPFQSYDPEKPADYTPEAPLVSLYPRLGQPMAAKGVDPFWEELKDTYASDRMFLMHWIIDVDGAYGFHNGDGQTTNVFINTYQRGLQESSFETVTHAAWNDWENGGGEFGYEPLFTQGSQYYSAAQFPWGKKWSYTSAPDSEARAVQWAYWADQFAKEQGAASLTAISGETEMAKKMGDYARYFFVDKYYRKIGDNLVGTTAANKYDSLHYLINWYVAWGGEIPLIEGEDGSWGYSVGCSECHHGYQAASTAYAMATGVGTLIPDSPTAAEHWHTSTIRQLEMIRWLQSPEGPIAGGVTNSWLAQYAPVTDGRQGSTFYGMHYTYSPVWHDPPSNNWVGFQGWGQGRTADLFLIVSDKEDAFSLECRDHCEVILDRLVAWYLPEVVFPEDGTFQHPDTLLWVTNAQVPGQTTTTANLEGVFEFIPNWSYAGEPLKKAQLWDASTVPNVNLHCSLLKKGMDLGVAASMAYLLLTYAEAKRRMGKFEDLVEVVGKTPFRPIDAYKIARRLLDRTWLHWDGVGVCVPEKRADYNRMVDPVYIPTYDRTANPGVFATGAPARFEGEMPNGDPIDPTSTFVSIRSFLKEDPMWEAVEAYIDNPIEENAPVFSYHRFWAQSEYAISCAAMHRYFGDINDTIEYVP